MRNTILKPTITSPINAVIDNIASDKSISHRSIIFSFLSAKKNKVRNFLLGEDTLNTLKIAMKLGMQVEINNGIESKIINSIDNINKNSNIKEITLLRDKNIIIEPNDLLDCGNAGTAIRLYIGLLATQKGYFVLSGDKYLRSRPMSRIIEPLNNIGANITARKNNSLAPITIIGKNIESFNYHSNISSAQVKSAMILSALFAKKESYFSEISLSRDHSERMLLGMGAKIEINDNKLIIYPIKNSLNPLDIDIPADPSSAFYFAILALIVKDSKITIKNMLLNKTRIEAFRVLEKMGAKIEITKISSQYEDIGDISISKKSTLKGVSISQNISWLIDEIPALAIIFAFANGKSEIKNASELRVKESDRIKATISNLIKFGVDCKEKDDGFIINGGFKIPSKRIQINSYGDHRIAMSFAVIGALCEVEILDSSCIDISFPNFLDIIKNFMYMENINGN
ncbi:3-phosphoshikimate 1-carboxyvinyltransferase [Helicobacter sp. MIT 14-3879]|uniref:3-phosphoshikimate 1-carboxyvinyltransferase n=1 Tax=Helicobacter sp. MIT 14-3879 TaxID=2040649 RepID=UPI000E1EF99A|nr:3-phosphoshikimate 1-carboxyvinyltransferase [Helicobacter sp. MIT 14-3879]RDU62895.1 3-phosphoshikimate 1-carboxyvinyltransferase [Helicobacter sp. MIT 14-3879]